MTFCSCMNSFIFYLSIFKPLIPIWLVDSSNSLLASHSGGTLEDMNFIENIILLHKCFRPNCPLLCWLQVTVVVNYDMPVEPTGKPDFETYLRRIGRIGRTGRFGKNGIVVNFIDGSRSMNILKKIEEHFGRKISLLETNDFEELEKLNWDLCYVKNYLFLYERRCCTCFCWMPSKEIILSFRNTRDSLQCMMARRWHLLYPRKPTGS